MSLWMTGTTDSMKVSEDVKMKASGTLDIVHGDFKIRAKGDIVAVDGSAYIKMNSMNGTVDHALASMSFNGAQKRWFTLPFSDLRSELMTTDLPLDLSSIDPATANDIFKLQTASSAAGTVYTLHLTTDAAVNMAMEIRKFLGSSAPVSSDFFPWRELAEGMRYELTINTDAAGHFVSSHIAMSLESLDAAFSSIMSETALKGPFVIKAPADALSSEAFMDMVVESWGSMDDANTDPGDEMQPMEPIDGGIMEQSEEPVSDDDASSDETCATASPLQLLSLQRSGTCKVTKVPTRYAR